MNIYLVYVHQLDDLKDTGNLINIAYNDYYPGGKARDYTKNIFYAAIVTGKQIGRAHV